MLEVTYYARQLQHSEPLVSKSGKHSQNYSSIAAQLGLSSVKL